MLSLNITRLNQITIRSCNGNLTKPRKKQHQKILIIGIRPYHSTASMTSSALSTETVTTFDEPTSFYYFLEFEDGAYLGVDANNELSIACVGNDQIVWERLNEGREFRHVVTGEVVVATPSHSGRVTVLHRDTPVTLDDQPESGPVELSVVRGPSDLPSVYLDHLERHGWVCMPQILRPEVVDGLESVSGTGAYEGKTTPTWRNPIAAHVAVGQSAAEPVSLWVTREYMHTNQIRFAHSPSLAVLPPDDGERDVQGWHSDFPYLWGIARTESEGRIPVHAAPQLVLGVQRNLCISPFTKEGGATAFKLGSSNYHKGPPREWGTGTTYFPRGYRKEHGLPYNGPESDIVDAPAGSIILYDARTWHRAGVNRSEKLRGAMLQAIIPHFMMPFFDTTESYRHFLKSNVVEQLNQREFFEIESLMLNRIGDQVISVDRELTQQINPQSGTQSSGY